MIKLIAFPHEVFDIKTLTNLTAIKVRLEDFELLWNMIILTEPVKICT